MIRNYTHAVASLRQQVRRDLSLDERLSLMVAVYWQHFGFDQPGPGRDVSWCGFYRREASNEPGHEMTLVCREPKPACSPIGLEGMCGRGWRDEAAYVVRDVRVLGSNYIACDPRDQSELVIPIWDCWGGSTGRCWGVFDVDSYDIGAFTQEDAFGTIALLEQAGLVGVDLLHRGVRVL